MIDSVKYLVKEGFKNVWINRLMSIASVGVLISCLLLTGASVLFCGNVSNALKTVEKQNVVTVYLYDDVSILEAVQVGNEIKEISNINNCEFYSKEEAMERFVDELGPIFGELQGEENPLPNAFKVTLDDLSEYEQTVEKIKSLDGVEQVSDRSDVAQKFTDLNKLVATASVWVVLILSLVSLFIISNTISVTMYSRRLEISIMKSVGATDDFIRVPFMIEGAAIGVISAVISTILLALFYDSLFAAIGRILPFTSIPFGKVVLPVFFSFILAGIMFGLIGGLISIRKYLKKNGGGIIGL